MCFILLTGIIILIVSKGNTDVLLWEVGAGRYVTLLMLHTSVLVLLT